MITFFRCKPGNYLHEAWKPGTVTIDSYKRSDISEDRFYYRPVKTHVANPTVTLNNSPKLSDAVVNMMSCIDLSVSGVQAAAKVMEANLPKFLGTVGKVTPWVGIADNLNQMRIEGFNKNDMSQVGAGIALVGVAAIGGTAMAPVVFVGGLGLFVWELGEAYMSQEKN